MPGRSPGPCAHADVVPGEAVSIARDAAAEGRTSHSLSEFAMLRKCYWEPAPLWACRQRVEHSHGPGRTWICLLSLLLVQCDRIIDFNENEIIPSRVGAARR